MQGLEVDFERKEGINYFNNSRKKQVFLSKAKDLLNCFSEKLDISVEAPYSSFGGFFSC